MHSEWRVTSHIYCDVKKYAVYRIINTSEVDHSGNRDYATGYMEDKEMAEGIAERLNEEARKANESNQNNN